MTKKPTLRIFLIAIAIVFVGLFLFSPIIQKQIFNSGVSTVHAIGAPAGAAMGGTKEAKIDDILNAPLPIVGAVVKEVLLILSSVVGLLIPVAAGIVGFAMQINLDLLQPSANVAVSVGWNIFRQITNLGFVLGIIIIAIATILRSRSYRAQQILWKLVAAALLVNFSLVIAGSFLSVSDVFSKYFLAAFTGKTYTSPNNTIAKISGGTVAISTQNNEIIKIVMGDLVDFSGAANMMSPDKNRGTNTGFLNYLANAKIFGGFSFNDIIGKNATVSIILSQIIQLVLFIIIFLAFIVLAGQIFIRYFYVTALLIVSPIVYLAWVFPFGHEWWREWWNHFIKWTFMLPLNLFFLWLAVRMLVGVKDATSKMADSMITSTTGGGAIFTGVTSFSALMGSIMAVAFIILGMKLAHKIGISTADTSVKWASSAGNYVRDKGVEYSKRGAAKAFVRTGAAEGVQTGLTALGSTTIGRALGIGKMAQRFAVGRVGVEKKAGAFAEEKTKQYEEIFKAKGIKGVEALLDTATSQERAVMLAFLASENKLGPDSEAMRKFGEEQVLISAEALERDGQKKRADAIYASLGYKREGLNARGEYTRNKTDSALESAYTELELVRMKKGTGTATEAEVRVAEEKYGDAMTADQIAQQKIRSIRSQFDKDYIKVDEQRKITKALYAKEEGDLTAGEKVDRLAHADDVISDPSGRRFFGALPALDNDKKILGLLKNLVKSATKQTELSGKLNESFQNALAGGKDNIKNFRIEMKNSGANDVVTNRIINQIKKSIAGDLGSLEFSAKAETGEKPKEEPKEKKE